jgi:hypothetical protein
MSETGCLYPIGVLENSNDEDNAAQLEKLANDETIQVRFRFQTSTHACIRIFLTQRSNSHTWARKNGQVSSPTNCVVYPQCIAFE